MEARSFKRSTGKFALSIIQIAAHLKQGYNVSIMAHRNDDSIQRYIIALKEKGCDVEYKEVTRKVPANPLRMKFDKWDEPIGMEIIEQKEEFAGWILSRKP